MTVAVDQVQKRYAVKVPHCKQFNPAEVKAELGLAHDAWGKFTEQVGFLAERKITNAEAIHLLIKAIGNPELPIEEQQNARVIANIFNLFDGGAIGASDPSANGTAWGLVNAVTQYSDHGRRTRTRDSRLDSTWWGEWENKKRRIMEYSLQLAA